MQLIITTFLFLFSFFVHHFCLADVVLVPQFNVNFLDYSQKCQQTGYQCTYNVLQQQIQSSNTPLLDDFIDHIDLSSKDFINGASKKIVSILENEMLSLTQLEQVLHFIEQVKSVSSQRTNFELIEQDLSLLKKLLLTNELDDQSDLYIIFKKAVTPEVFKKISLNFLKVPAVHLQYASVPQKLNLRNKKAIQLVPLLTGSCETASLNSEINFTNWLPYELSSCTFSEGVSKISSSSIEFIENHQKLLTGLAVAVGIGLFLNNYEVKFQF